MEIDLGTLQEEFVAGETVGALARRYRITARQVKTLLMEAATRLAEPETEAEDAWWADGRLRCRACGILLSEEWTTWDDRGLCDDCQEQVADLAFATGMDEGEILRLWTAPVADPYAPTPLERAIWELLGWQMEVRDAIDA